MIKLLQNSMNCLRKPKNAVLLQRRSVGRKWLKRTGSIDSRYSTKRSRYIQDYNAGRAVGSSGQPPWFDRTLKDQKGFLNGKLPLSETLFSALDQVLGNEHTTNPPVIISPIADTPILEASGSRRETTPSSTLITANSTQDDDTDSTNPFTTGKKVKRKKNDKSEAIIDLMMQGLEIKESELEERRKDREILARAEDREQKLLDFMEILVKHLVRE
jgi:hypothetical protein